MIFTERIKWKLLHHYMGKENFISQHLKVSSAVMERKNNSVGISGISYRNFDVGDLYWKNAVLLRGCQDLESVLGNLCY